MFVSATLTIHDNIEQRSPEWFALRRGIVTASTVGQLLTVRKLSAIDFHCPACGVVATEPCASKRSGGGAIKTLHPERAEYARTNTKTVIEPASNDDSRSLTALLVAERITGWTDPTFVSDAMWMGIEGEPLAREKYSEHYAPVTEAGLMIENRWGYRIAYSPDGLVGQDGLIEIKTRRSKAQLSTILAGVPPMENMAQLQCALLVSGRKWIDYVSYCGGMPLWVRRVHPDHRWFDAIARAVTAFENNAAEMVRIYNESIEGLPMTERVIETEMVI